MYFLGFWKKEVTVARKGCAPGMKLDHQNVIYYTELLMLTTLIDDFQRWRTYDTNAGDWLRPGQMRSQNLHKLETPVPCAVYQPFSNCGFSSSIFFLFLRADFML